MIVKWLRRAYAVTFFSAYFLLELTLANLKVALDVLTNGRQVTPGIVAMHTSAGTRTEITLLANLVSLTPGTLVLDISSDRKVLFLHVMHLEDVKHFPAFEARFMRMFR